MSKTASNFNDLSDTALSLSQAAQLASVLGEYDAPKMHWGQDSDRSETFRRECADEVRSRLDRRVKENGLAGFAVALSEEEYRVCVEALTQSDDDTGELIKHLQYFKRSHDGY